MPLTTTVRAAAPAGYETPLLILVLPTGGLPASLGALDRQAQGALSRVLGTGDFAGKKDEWALLHPPGPAARILLVGMGKAGEQTRGAIRRAAAIGAKRARGLGVPAGAFHLAPEALGPVTAMDAGQVIA